MVVRALSGPKSFTFQQPDGKIIHILQHPTQQNTLVFQLQNSQNLKNNSKTGFQELTKTFSPSFGAQFDWTVEYHESSQVLLFIICARSDGGSHDYTYARIYLNQFDSNGLSDLESWIQNSGSSQTRGMLAGGNDPISGEKILFLGVEIKI